MPHTFIDNYKKNLLRIIYVTYLQNKFKFPGYVYSVFTSRVENIHHMGHTEISVVVAYGYFIASDESNNFGLTNRSSIHQMREIASNISNCVVNALHMCSFKYHTFAFVV